MNIYRFNMLSMLIASFFAFAIMVHASWQRTYGGIYDNAAFGMQVTRQKEFIMAGYTNDCGSTPYHFLLMKVNGEGDSLWAIDCGYGWAFSVIQTYNDGYVCTGYYNLPHNYGVVWVNSGGDTIRTRTYGEGGTEASSIVIQTNDSCFIIIWDTDPTEHDLYIMKIDSIGDTIWTNSIGREDNDYALCIVPANDGNYIIVGSTLYPFAEVDAYIVKINSLGEMVWDIAYGGTGTNEACHIDTTRDGNYIITGRTSLYYYILFDIYLLKINDDGDTLWTRKIGGEDQSDIGRCVRPTTDGGYIITGWTYSYGIGTPDYSNVYLVKTDSEGYVEWEQTYGGTGEDKGYSVSQTDDGGYIIAGVYDQGAHTDVYLIKTDSLGNVDWISEAGMKPQEITLNVYPNPFNSSCRIAVWDAWMRPAEVEIYDLRGNLVWEAYLSDNKERTQRIAKRDGQGEALWRPAPDTPSGVYLVRARAGDNILSKKIVLIR